MTTRRRTHPRRHVALSLLVGALLAGNDARALETGVSAASQQLFEEGRALVTAGKAPEACPKFEESYRLEPRTGTKFNLADCYAAVGRFASAWTLFLEVAAESKVTQRLDREQIARSRAAELVPHLSRLVIQVPRGARVPGLAVERSGVSVGEAQWGSAVPLDAGEHTIRAIAPGRKPWEARVTIPGDGATISVKVAPLAPLSPESGEPQVAPSRGLSTQRTVALGLGGTGLVAVGVGAYFGAHAMSRLGDSEGACNGNRCASRSGAEAYDDARHAGNAATIAFSVGAVALLAGGVLFFTEPERDGAEIRARDGARTVAVGVGPGSVVARGTF